MNQFLTAAFLTLGIWQIAAKEAVYINVNQVCKAPHIDNAILRKDPLFTEDFLTIHSLLRMAMPTSIFEIGTCTGEGTLIIKNAVKEGIVFSLDLPPGETSYDLPVIGDQCHLPYVQIIGNSLTIQYKNYYPIDAWFIDGAHDYSHVYYETREALQSSPSLIMWHDADIPEVLDAIKDGLEKTDYLLFRVVNTRIAFSVPSGSKIVEMIDD